MWIFEGFAGQWTRQVEYVIYGVHTHDFFWSAQTGAISVAPSAVLDLMRLDGSGSELSRTWHSLRPQAHPAAG